MLKNHFRSNLNLVCSLRRLPWSPFWVVKLKLNPSTSKLSKFYSLSAHLKPCICLPEASAAPHAELTAGSGQKVDFFSPYTGQWELIDSKFSIISERKCWCFFGCFEGVEMKRPERDSSERWEGSRTQELHGNAIQMRLDPGPTREYVVSSSPVYFYLQLRDVYSIWTNKLALLSLHWAQRHSR